MSDIRPARDDAERRLPVALTLDTTAYRRAMADAERSTRGFTTAIGRGFSEAATRGRGLSDVVSGLALRLSRLALSEVLKPLTQGLAAGLSSANLFGGGAPGETSSAESGGTAPWFGPFDPATMITPFAAGGVIGAPSYFPMPEGGLGLAGERGAEAILPLARGSDGRLGVRLDGGGADGPPVVVNIHTPDVEGFRRSEALVSAALARAVARGRRHL